MKQLQYKRLPAALLACSVLALGSIAFSGAALAADAAPVTTSTVNEASSPAAGQKKHRGERRHRHHHGHKFGQKLGHRLADGAMMVPGYGPIPQDVVASLSLDGKQQALLDEATSFLDDQRKQRREKAREGQARGKEAAAATIDPHARVERQQERFAAMQTVHADATAKWLAVWDALDSAQQEKVSEYIAQRREARAERHAKWREHRAAKREAHRAEKQAAEG